jgi:hypothetical protein
MTVATTVVFPCLGDEVLGKRIAERLRKLNYKIDKMLEEWTTESGFFLRNGCVYHCKGSIPALKNLINGIPWDDRVIGNLTDLFFTDKYAIAKPPIRVELNHEYTAEVSDVIKVGCTTFTRAALDALNKAVKSYDSKE